MGPPSQVSPLGWQGWQHKESAKWPLAPPPGHPGVRQVARIGEGQQIGAISHRAALPPLIAFNLEPEDHFQRALNRAQQPLPFEETPVVDADLRFVASIHIEGLHTLDWRRRAVGALRELG